MIFFSHKETQQELTRSGYFNSQCDFRIGSPRCQRPCSDFLSLFVFFVASPAKNHSDFGVRRLVAALAFSQGIFGNRRGEIFNNSFQFQVKSAGQTNLGPRAKRFEKKAVTSHRTPKVACVGDSQPAIARDLIVSKWHPSQLGLSGNQFR